MQVAVAKLAVAIVVIEVVGDIHLFLDSIKACRAEGSPSVVERGDGTTPFRFRGREAHGAASHRHAGGYGNASLLVVVHGTVEMIHHPIVFHHIALMGKHLVVGLRRVDQVRAIPTLPMDEVARNRKGVEKYAFFVA